MTGDAPAGLVALVVMRPAGGRHAPDDLLVTAQTLERVRPDPADVAAVQDALRGAGFAVGTLVGTSMSIAGPGDLFARYFGVQPHQQPDGSWAAVTAAPDPRLLPLDRVPDDVRRRVRAVTFESPVDLV